MKYLFTVVITIFLVGCANSQTVKSPNPEPVSPSEIARPNKTAVADSQVAAPVEIVEKKLDKRFARCLFEIKYPQIAQPDKNNVPLEINDFLKREFSKIDEYREICRERQAGNKKYRVTAEYSVKIVAKGVLSLAYEASGYGADGGAYPINSRRAYNLSLTTGKPIAYIELFRPESDYQKIINKIIARQLSEGQTSELESPNAKKYEFLITADELIIFNPFGDVHALQGIDIPIKWSEIKDIVNQKEVLQSLIAES